MSLNEDNVHLPKLQQEISNASNSCRRQTEEFQDLCVCVDSLQQTYEAKRLEFLGELQRREEEMRQTFVQRVKEKEAELKDAEREV